MQARGDNRVPSVLVVDDFEQVRRLLTEALEEEGYRVVEAVDGYEAVARLEDERFDLVLTDVRMPGMDGFAVVRAARQIAPHMPIVLMTGAPGPAMDMASIATTDAGPSDRLAIDAFCPKPLDPRRVVDTVRGLIA